jgi:hypothetical protein
MQRGMSEIVVALSLIIITTMFSSKQAESLLMGRYKVRRSDAFSGFIKRVQLRSSTNNLDDNIPINSEVPLESNPRKKRRNKYENFSRVNMSIDPLEALIEESKRKNHDLLIDNESSKRRPHNDGSVEIPSTPSKLFPDVKSIDVSSIVGHFSTRNLFDDCLTSLYQRCVSLTIRKPLDI